METDETSTIEAIPVGTECQIIVPNGDDFPGLVIAIKIESQGRVSYEVAWWDGRGRNEEWMGRNEIEVSLPQASYTKVGFARPAAADGEG